MIDENRLDKKLKYAELFSFYSELFTDKQRDVFQLYCYQDLSLSEISEDLSISRQAVHDTIHRVEDLLDVYEQKLSLSQKFNNRREKIKELNKLVTDIDERLKQVSRSPLVECKDEICELIDEFSKLKIKIDEIDIS